MHGTFNGIELRNITSFNTERARSGCTNTTFRVLDRSMAKLEQILQLRAPALLIVRDQDIKGRIVHYCADVSRGYEITIESTQ